MKEVEAKIYDVQAEHVRADLKRLGAVPVKSVLQKNIYYGNDDTSKRHVKVRIRTEDGQSLLQVKIRKGLKDRYKTEDEYELAADAQTAHIMLTAIGLTVLDEIHIKREYYRLSGCSVEICQLPRVRPYLEIEGPREQIGKTATALGFDKSRFRTEGPRKYFNMRGKRWVF